MVKKKSVFTRQPNVGFMNTDYAVKIGKYGMPWYGVLFNGSESQTSEGIFPAHKIPAGKPMKKYPK